jgi:hypothetical protein
MHVLNTRTVIMRRPVICLSFALLIFLTGLQADLQAYSKPPKLLNIQSQKDCSSERVYFHSSSGDIEALLSLRKYLIRQGAHNVNCFAPFVVTCKLPNDINYEKYLINTDIVPLKEQEIEGVSAGDYVFGPRWVKQCYKTAANPPTNEEEDALALAAFDRFKMPVMNMPNRPLKPIAVSSPAETEYKRYFQNSEFMVGDILAQIVYPESRGAEENWTNSQLSAAGSAAATAMIFYQEKFPRAPIDFVIRSVTQADTDTEPINFRREEQAIWVTDVMNNLGYPGDPDEYLEIVNEFNNEWRVQWGTDWVFTAFIVNAANDPDHLFGVRPAKPLQLVVSEFGGPHMAVPYPSGYPGWQPLRQTFLYGLGHVFWAEYEHVGITTECEDRSGYLNYKNWNKTVSIGPMNAREGCSFTMQVEYCIMNIEDVYNYFVEYACPYTTGMLGLADENNNRVPDAVDAAPGVVFNHSVLETTLTDSFLLEFDAISTAVKNRNSQQPVSMRLDYALPIKDVNYLVNGIGPIQVLPIDGINDEMSEEYEVGIDQLIPGISLVEVITRNTLGATSRPHVKRIYYVGLNYIHFTFTYTNEGIGVAWNMLGETFDASFDLHRIEMEPFPRDTILASNIQAALPPSGYFTPYYFLDETAVPKQEYQYYVTGTFTTHYRGRDTTITHISDKYKAIGSIQIEKQNLISSPSPNPFRDQTWISISVPTSTREADFRSSRKSGLPGNISQSPTVQDDIPTCVEISIYNILGQRVKHLHHGWSYSTVLTIPWDGTNDNNERLPSGVYFLRATAGPYTQVRKVSIVR